MELQRFVFLSVGFVFCLFFLYYYPFWTEDLQFLALEKLVRKILCLPDKMWASQPGDYKHHSNDYWAVSAVKNTLNEKINPIFRKMGLYKSKILKNLFDRTLIQTKLKVIPFSSVYNKIPTQM